MFYWFATFSFLALLAAVFGAVGLVVAVLGTRGAFQSWLMGVALFSTVVIAGCAGVTIGYGVSDPYYTSPYRDGDSDSQAYVQWTTETHRKTSRDYLHLSAEEQSEYRQWRHAVYRTT